VRHDQFNVGLKYPLMHACCVPEQFKFTPCIFSGTLVIMKGSLGDVTYKLDQGKGKLWKLKLEAGLITL
jgi:hypothetical protein